MRIVKFSVVVLMMAIGLTLKDYHHDIWCMIFLCGDLGLAARWGIPDIFSRGSLLGKQP